MRTPLFSIVVVLLWFSGARAKSPDTRLNPIVRALLSQARQYVRIKTIHFLAIGHYKVVANGSTNHYRERYEYWGAGVKYRIDFQQFLRSASFDILMTDNGRHFKYFDRIADQLRVMRSHPTHGETPDMRNPILEPLMFLIPPNARWHWLNLARIARNPESVLSRCRAISNCGATVLAGAGLRGCLAGSLAGKPVQFSFTIPSRRRGLVTDVFARQKKSGNYLHLLKIAYRAIHTTSGHVIELPVSFIERGRENNASVSVAMAISHLIIDQPISPAKFTINYKLAKVVVDETGRGKWKYITVQPTHPAPGGTRNLK
jgi:hypothetical protein